MLFSHATIILALTSLINAAPYTQAEKRTLGWGSSSDHSNAGAFYDWTSRKSHNWRGRGSAPPAYQQNSAPGQCDLASVSLPQAPKPLPAPSEGMKLYHVAVGRGTQNYTCDLNNSTAVPLAAGAVASLFNVTCLSANSPTLLTKLPNIALDLPVPQSSDPTSPISQDLSGHHYFTDSTTAYFNLDTSLTSYGAGGFKKINSTAAPDDACAGQNGKGYGAVPWLKLTAKMMSDDCVFQEVYRINTAGGVAPDTCVGQKAEFEIEYSAEYWFYEPS
ncbi:hypothetical protein AC578_8680 [Pseudocercospora eumusae]|uniref:Malate dehydrogenase n=1 Tax=Pseudocercospora eumusae TaxID=321146 RepID=A0A139HQC2_9PEZI|nr:hypothetical protein AC578_8680 [Pseudocercospora eumusae]